MSKRKGVYAAKVKRATHMLFFRRHQKPGVKGWELHKTLGSDYPKVLDVLDDYLKNLDLQAKTVFEEEKTPVAKPTLEELVFIKPFEKPHTRIRTVQAVSVPIAVTYDDWQKWRRGEME